jgi:hypothetical protein
MSAFCVDTQQILGVITWGYRVPDNDKDPIIIQNSVLSAISWGPGGPFSAGLRGVRRFLARWLHPRNGHYRGGLAVFPAFSAPGCEEIAESVENSNAGDFSLNASADFKALVAKANGGKDDPNGVNGVMEHAQLDGKPKVSKPITDQMDLKGTSALP